MQLLTSFVATGSTFARSRAVGIRAFGADFAHGLSSSSLPLADAVNAWSVSGSSLNSEDLASSLFGASLLPYLAFLYFLSRPASKTPEGGLFGFRFLLFFVFATIPAGIYAKVQYHDILANVDWLHGTAESMLTLTNLFLILGFRATRPKPDGTSPESQVKLFDAATPLLLIATALPATLGFLHPEPANALSVPTWVVHSSSLLEWLVAMKLIWEHAETSGNPRWKGLTWAMIPSHTSGICACTYHFFYNAPVVNWIVALQAFLTFAGNTCLALAAYRISKFEPGVTDGDVSSETPSSGRVAKPLEESDAAFVVDMALRSVLVAVAVKYGELAFDLPFEQNPSIAAALIIALGTSVNVLKWVSRSQEQEQASPAVFSE